MHTTSIALYRQIRQVACCVLVVLTASLSGCSDSTTFSNIDNRPQQILSLERVSQNTLEFKPFDVVDPMTTTVSVTLAGATFYRGELIGFDMLKVDVYAVVNPAGSISSRTLVYIAGDTGFDPRFMLDRVHNHRIMFVLSQRGLHPDDLMNECPLGSGFVNCLLTTSDLADFNPDINGNDLIDLVSELANTNGILNIDDTTTTIGAFLGDAIDPDNIRFNIATDSYGATIFGYALTRPLPRTVSWGRIFIDGPLSPSNVLISDGFSNSRNVLGNLMDVYEMSAAQQSAFLDVLRQRHTAPSAFPSTDDRHDADDPLSSAQIIRYMFNTFNALGASTMTSAQITQALGDARALLVSITTGTSGAGQRNSIRNAAVLNDRDRAETRWELHIADFLASATTMTALAVPEGSRVLGVTQRTAQLCAAYISRVGGDSQTRFDTALALGSNDPYWYGFYIMHRQLLSICPQIRDNTRNDLTVPSIAGLSINAEAIVQYGAGLDERGSMRDITEIMGYFSDTIIRESVYVDNQLRSGGGPFHQECLSNLIEATYEQPLSGLAAAIDTVRTDNCGL